VEDFILEEVLARAKALEPEAMAALCTHYYPRVLKFMYYRTDRNDAEDLVGEVFLRVMRSLAGQNGNFEAWLFKIARNIVVDHGKARSKRLSLTADNEALENMPSKTDSVAVIDVEMDVEKALRHLNDEQREVLLLHFIQGFGCLEIADIMKKSHGAVRALQFRGLSALRKIMEA
jgi:RNA polymerase sigma-70 factor (ECF subfamily)